MFSICWVPGAMQHQARGSDRRWTLSWGLGKEVFASDGPTRAPKPAMMLSSTVTLAMAFSLTFSWSPWYLP